MHRDNNAHLVYHLMSYYYISGGTTVKSIKGCISACATFFGSNNLHLFVLKVFLNFNRDNFIDKEVKTIYKHLFFGEVRWLLFDTYE